MKHKRSYLAAAITFVMAFFVRRRRNTESLEDRMIDRGC